MGKSDKICSGEAQPRKTMLLVTPPRVGRRDYTCVSLQKQMTQLHQRSIHWILRVDNDNVCRDFSSVNDDKCASLYCAWMIVITTWNVLSTAAERTLENQTKTRSLYVCTIKTNTGLPAGNGAAPGLWSASDSSNLKVIAIFFSSHAVGRRGVRWLRCRGTYY